jgi:hypothetical protein
VLIRPLIDEDKNKEESEKEFKDKEEKKDSEAPVAVAEPLIINDGKLKKEKE